MNMATMGVGLPTRIWLRTSIMSEPKLLMELHDKDITNAIRSNPEYNKLLLDVLRIREIDPNYMVSSIYVDTTTSENPLPFVNYIGEVARTGYLEGLNKLLSMQMVIYHTLEDDSVKIERAVKKLMKRIHKIGDFSIRFTDLANKDSTKIYQMGSESTFNEILCILDEVHSEAINTMDKTGNPDLITTASISFSSKFIEDGVFLFATSISEIAARLKKYKKKYMEITTKQIMIPIPERVSIPVQINSYRYEYIHKLSKTKSSNHKEMNECVRLWNDLWSTVEACSGAMHAFDITSKVPTYFYI